MNVMQHNPSMSQTDHRSTPREFVADTSATSTPEPAAPSGAFSVTGGSLPVSSAEALCLAWESAAIPLKNKTVRSAAYWPLVAEAKARAEIYELCAAELRRHAGLPSLRQPEENAEMSHVSAAKNKPL